MNLNNITKTALNAYVGKKIASQTKETNDQITALIDSMVDPVIASIIDVKQIEQAAKKFADLYEDAIESHGDVMDWNYQDVLQKTNRFAIVLQSKLTDEYKRKVVEHIREPHRKAISFYSEKLIEITKQMQELTKPLFERITKLKKLHSELEHAIKLEHNGSRAYKALVAFGVDMEGFEEVNANLPAVVKLSVDVCLMNGNCEEKSA